MTSYPYWRYCFKSIAEIQLVKPNMSINKIKERLQILKKSFIAIMEVVELWRLKKCQNFTQTMRWSIDNRLHLKICVLELFTLLIYLSSLVSFFELGLNYFIRHFDITKIWLGSPQEDINLGEQRLFWRLRRLDSRLVQVPLLRVFRGLNTKFPKFFRNIHIVVIVTFECGARNKSKVFNIKTRQSSRVLAVNK